MNATIRIPATNAQIQARPYPSHGFEVLASVRLDLLAEALGAMEHDDTEPDVRRMNADQCRDALLREILLGWSQTELVEAKIPGVLEMAQDLEDLRATLSRVEAERDALMAERLELGGDPPAGYRLMEIGEAIEPGDLCRWSDRIDDPWEPFMGLEGGEVVEGKSLIFCRKHTTTEGEKP